MEFGIKSHNVLHHTLRSEKAKAAYKVKFFLTGCQQTSSRLPTFPRLYSSYVSVLVF